MLSKVKTALRKATGTSTLDVALDEEILDLIAAGIEDLKADGTIFDYDVLYADDKITDYEVEDKLVSMAIVTYCRCNFGSPDNYDRLKASYDEQKAQLRGIER